MDSYSQNPVSLRGIGYCILWQVMRSAYLVDTSNRQDEGNVNPKFCYFFRLSFLVKRMAMSMAIIYDRMILDCKWEHSHSIIISTANLIALLHRKVH